VDAKEALKRVYSKNTYSELASYGTLIIALDIVSMPGLYSPRK
jgi:hypothetical protein